jgi:hypothetical protein
MARLLRRLLPLPAAARRRREAGAGLPAIEPGMPTPGRHRPLAPLVPAARRRLALPSTAPRSSAAALRGGHRAAAPRRRRQAVLVSSSCRRRLDSLSVLAPVGDPKLRAAAPDARARRRRARRSPRTRGCTGTRRRGRSRRCTARARSPSSRRSATTTPTSRTSPRATTGRSARSTRRRTGWLGRYLDRVGDPTTRCRGCRSTRASRRRSRPRTCRSRRRRARPTTTSGRPASATRSRPMLDAIGALGRAAGADPALAQARARAAAASTSCAAARAVRQRRQAFYTPGDLPERRLPEAAGGARGDARAGCRCGASRCRARQLRHALDQATTLTNLQLTCDGAARLPARPRGARARRPRARERVVASSAAGRRRTARGTDHGAAGCAFLIGTRAAGRWSASSPA